MKPLGDRVLVEIIQAEQQKKGIIIPQSEQQKHKGKVVVTGVKTEVIKVGDTVQFYPGSGTSIKHNGKDCLFLSEAHEVIAIL